MEKTSQKGNLRSWSGDTGMLMSFSVSAEDRTRIVYATACKGWAEYEGRISQQNTKYQGSLDWFYTFLPFKWELQNYTEPTSFTYQPGELGKVTSFH